MAFEHVILFLVLCAGWCAPALGLFCAAYGLLSLPLRRRERARFFLDVLESTLRAGQSPERTLAAMGRTRDNSLGRRFRRLAALLESGHRLDTALEAVPDLLPQRLQAMLRIGLARGDLGRVLPACRYQLRDAFSHVQSATNYLVLLVFASFPATAVVTFVLAVYVFPKFRAILADLGAAPPFLSAWVFEHAGWWAALGIVGLIVLLVWAVCFAGGPRLQRWLRQSWPEGVDSLLWRIPWHRRRLLRDFLALFALLLDQGVAEGEALTLAADGTASRRIERQAAAARAALAAGQRLPEALRLLDHAAPFPWHVRNAVARPGRFAESLAGWLEALDARAFQQEQAAAQSLTTGLVLGNGVLVGCLVAAVFLTLIAIIQGGLQW